MYAQFQCVVDESNNDYNGTLSPAPMFVDVYMFDGIVSLSMQLLWKKEKKSTKRTKQQQQKY